MKVDECVERLKGDLTAQSRDGAEQTTSQTVDRLVVCAGDLWWCSVVLGLK